MKIAIVGIDSMLGSALAKVMPAHSIVGTTRHRERVSASCVYLNLLKPEVESLPQVDIAVICAGVVLLAECQANPCLTWAVNVDGVMKVARHYLDQGAAVVYLSTAAVFPGNEPYCDRWAAKDGLSVYGRLRACVEDLLRQHQRTTIIRFGKVIPPDWALFHGWVAELRTGRTIHPYANMVFAPVSQAFAAETIARIIEGGLPSVWQFTAADDISYAQAAYCLADRLHLDKRLIEPVEVPRSSLPHGSLFAYATLNSSKVTKWYGVEMPPALEAVHAFAEGVLHA